MNIRYIEYDGDNIKLINKLKAKSNIDENTIFRSSDIKHLLRVLEYGTDRAGYDSNKMWEDGIPYEDVIIATDERDIIKGEEDINYSNSFKKFAITENPILILYDRRHFDQLSHKEFRFIGAISKVSSVKEIFVIKKVSA